MDTVGFIVWNFKRRQRNIEKEGFGEKLYHRGIVYVYLSFLPDRAAGGTKCHGTGAEVLALHRNKIICHFSRMDVQF